MRKSFPSTDGIKYKDESHGAQDISLSWKEFGDSVEGLAKLIVKSGWKPDVIIGAFQGGYLVSQALSDYFEKSECYGARSCYDGRMYVSVIFPTEDDSGCVATVQGKHVLLVDEVVETGTTMDFHIEGLSMHKPSSIRTACLFVLDKKISRPDYWVRSFNSKSKIILPWRKWRDNGT